MNICFTFPSEVPWLDTSYPVLSWLPSPTFPSGCSIRLSPQRLGEGLKSKLISPPFRPEVTLTEARSGRDHFYLLFANLAFDGLLPAFIFSTLLLGFFLLPKSRTSRQRWGATAPTISFFLSSPDFLPETLHICSFAFSLPFSPTSQDTPLTW